MASRWPSREFGGVELLRQLGDAILERAERKLIALAELHAVEPFAQRADRAFQLGRHGAAAFHQRRDPCFELGERFGAAVGGGALELRAKPAHLGGKLRQRAVRGDVGDDAAQRHHGLLELLERHRVALGRLAGRGDLIDLVRQAAHRLFETGQAFGRRETAERVAHLGELAFERSERRAIGAGLPGAVDPLGQGTDLGFERLDGSARHGVGQRPPDLGQIAAQRAERVLVGLMQRRNLRVDVVELLLQAGQVRSATPVRRCGAAGSRCGGRARRRARAGARKSARPSWRDRGRARPAVAAERVRTAGECGRRRRRISRRCWNSLAARAALVNDLIEPAIEPRQRIRDAIGALVRAAGAAARLRIRLRHAFELPRQGVETLIDGGEVFADGVLVVVRLSV